MHIITVILEPAISYNAILEFKDNVKPWLLFMNSIYMNLI